MGTTFNYEIGSRPNRLGKYSIYLRITQDRKPKRVKTGVELSSVNDWNPKRQQVRMSEPRYRKYNDILDKFKQEAKNAYVELRDGGTATPEQILIKLSQKETPESFFEYLQKRGNDFYKEGRFASKTLVFLIYNKLRDYQAYRGLKGRDLLFRDITPSFLSDFEIWLTSLKGVHTGKPLSPETISSYFRGIRNTINRAIKFDKLVKPEDNPFLCFNIKNESRTKEKLNSAEIYRIISLQLPEGSQLRKTRDVFLFSFYCAGIRLSDCIRLRWRNITDDGRLQYKMSKTGKNQDILLVPQAREILDYYRNTEAQPSDFIFPLIRRKRSLAYFIADQDEELLDLETKRKIYVQNRVIGNILNRNLRVISEMSGISKKVTFHTARHSFAHVAKEKGADNIVLRDLLKHSSLRTTERYIGSFGRGGNDRALQAIFGDSQADRERSELLERICRLSTKELKDILNNTV